MIGYDQIGHRPCAAILLNIVEKEVDQPVYFTVEAATCVRAHQHIFEIPKATCLGKGLLAKTSRPAPASFPSRNADSSASWSTSDPRDML